MFKIIDIEITGVNAFDEVLELAIIATSGDVIENSLFKTDEHISPAITNLTGITFEESRNGVEFSSLSGVFDDSSDVFCSYHLQHDINWWAHTQGLYELPVLSELSGVCLSEIVSSMLKLDPGRYITLDEALSRFLPRDQYDALNYNNPPHRALNDAIRHRALLLGMMSSGLTKDKVLEFRKTFTPRGI